MKKKLSIAFSLSISVICLFWAFSLLDWNRFLDSLKSANLLYFIPITGIIFIHYLLRTIRWRYLLPDKGAGVSGLLLFDGIMVGNLMTFLFPLRAGEFARPLLVSLKSKIPFPTAFASIVVERFFDLATVLISLAIVTPLVPSLPEWVSIGAATFAGLGGAIFLVLVVATIAPQTAKRFVSFFTALAPELLRDKLNTIFDEILEGLVPVKDISNLLIIIVLTIAVWISNYYLFQIGFGLVGESTSFLVGTTVAVVLALAVAAPSAPGFIGVFQIACVAGFALFGFSEEKGAAYAVLLHAHAYLVFGIFGSLALLRYGISFGGLRKKS